MTNKKPERETRPLEQRLDAIMNRSGWVWPEPQEGNYDYRRFEAEEMDRYRIDTAAIIAYCRQHEPARLYDLEKQAGKYERALEKIKREVDEGQLAGKVIGDVYIPEGNPEKLYRPDTDLARWGMCSYPFIAFPLGIASLVDSWAQKNKSPEAHKVNEVVQKMCVPFHYGGLAFGFPFAVMVSLGLAMGKIPNASQRAYEKIENCRHKIFKLVPDELLF